MRIVIEINEKDYERMKDCPNVFDSLTSRLYKSVKDGTPLPKNHGRLIDADDLYENTEICHSDEDGYACVRWKDINDAPTIIEGSENE